jgi:flavorubredoxin
MVREIHDGVYWIQECSPKSVAEFTRKAPDWYDLGRQVHSCRNAFFVDSDSTLLFETLSPTGETQILAALESLLEGRSLDYVVPSHPENPHAGNTLEILDAYPEATLVAPSYGKTHELYHMDEGLKVSPGEEFDLGEHVVRFVQPTFADHHMHIWMYELTRDILFCVDWIGFRHMTGECLQFTDEMASPMTVERLQDHPQSPFFWFKFADPVRTDAATDELIDTYGSSTLAPSHGQVIRENPTECMEMMKDVVRVLKRDLEVTV